LISQELLPIMEELQALTASKGTGFISRCVNAEVIMSNDISRSILLQVRAKYYKPVPFNERRAGPAMVEAAAQVPAPAEEEGELVMRPRRVLEEEEELFQRPPTEAEMRRDLEARQRKEQQLMREQGQEDVQRRNLEARRRVEEAEARQGQPGPDELRQELADVETRRFMDHLNPSNLPQKDKDLFSKKASTVVSSWINKHRSQDATPQQVQELRTKFGKLFEAVNKKENEAAAAAAAAAQPRPSRSKAQTIRPSDASQTFQPSKKTDTKATPPPKAMVMGGPPKAQGGPLNIGAPQRVPAAASAASAAPAASTPKKKKLSAEERQKLNKRLADLQEGRRLAEERLKEMQAINTANPTTDNARAAIGALTSLATINQNIRDTETALSGNGRYRQIDIPQTTKGKQEKGNGRYRQIDIPQTTKGKQEKGNGRWTDYNGPDPVAVMRSLNGAGSAGSKSFRDTPMGQTNRQTRPVRDYDDLDYNDETNDTQEFGGVANKSEMLTTENRMVHMDPEWKGLPKRLNLPFKKVRRGNTMPSDKLY
jgi:hypothetical protein